MVSRGRGARPADGERAGSPARLPHPVAHLALDLAADVAIADLTPAVALLLAARQRQLDLGPGALEVDPGRDHRQALALEAAYQALDLVTVEEQLARALGIVVLHAGGGVGRDVGVSQPDLAVLDHRVGVADLGLSLAQRLDLAAGQLDPRLELLDQLVLVRGAPVGGDVARRRLALSPLAHAPTPAGSRSTRPRGASTASTRTATGSPRRIARPLRRPTIAVSVSLMSKRSPRRRRAGRKPS